MKTCPKCGISKREDEFYKDLSHKDGLSSHCKSCRIQKQRDYYLKHVPQKREYDAAYREEHREKYRAQCREYYGKHKAERLAYWKDYKSAPENLKREVAGWTARSHTTLSGQKCAVCGSTENLERHHPDYSRPLDIIVLCRDCHNKQKARP